MCVWFLEGTRLFGGELMTGVEDLASRLAMAWIDNYTLSGADAYMENEARRKSIIVEADALGIREAVYSRANSIVRGD